MRHRCLVYSLLRALLYLCSVRSVYADGRITLDRSLEEKDALRGKTSSLHCSIIEGEEVSFSWLKDGHVVNPSQRIAVNSDETGSKLTIRRTEVTDSGNYTCVARNQASAARITVRLYVKGSSTNQECYLSLR